MKNGKKLTVGIVIFAIALLAVTGIWHTSSFDKMGELRKDFADEVEIAMETSRMNLSAEIRELRDIHRELEDLQVVPWASEAKGALLRGMDSTIKGFLSFQGQDDDNEIAEFFDRAEASFDAYYDHPFVK